MTKLSDLLLKAAEFEPDRLVTDIITRFPGLSFSGSARLLREGGAEENARLINLIKLVAPVLDVAESNHYCLYLERGMPCDTCKTIANAREGLK